MATETKAPSTSDNAACNIGTFKGGPPPQQGGWVPGVVGQAGPATVVKTGTAYTGRGGKNETKTVGNL